jgi:hypothetical protein
VVVVAVVARCRPGLGNLHRIILSIEPRWWWWTGGEFLARQDAIAGEAVGMEGVDGCALL